MVFTLHLQVFTVLHVAYIVSDHERVLGSVDALAILAIAVCHQRERIKDRLRLWFFPRPPASQLARSALA